MLSTILCAMVAPFLVFLVFRKRLWAEWRTYQFAKSLKGPPLTPFLGSIQYANLKEDEVFSQSVKHAKIYKDGFRLWAPGLFVYAIYSVDSVEAVIANSSNNEKGYSYKFLKEFLGNGLLVSSDQKWFQRRKVLTPAFHFSILKNFLPSFKFQTGLVIKVLKEEEANKAKGTHLQKVLSRFTLNVICETAMGVRLTKANEMDDYNKLIHAYTKIHTRRLATPWLKDDWAFYLLGDARKEERLTDEIHKFTGSIIAAHRAAKEATVFEQADKSTSDEEDDYSSSGKRRYAMLDTLLQAEKRGEIDAAGIQEEVDTFVFEGYDTTMTTLQQRLFEEVKRICDDAEQMHEKVGLRQFNQMRYMECVIKETMRLYTTVPAIGRELKTETVLEGITFPVGTNILIFSHILHRDPVHFPDPERFDPERFTVEKSVNRHPFAYIPFSAGQRNCIGQKFAMLEMKSVLTEIVLNFLLEPVTRPEDITFEAEIVLRSTRPIYIRFKERA